MNIKYDISTLLNEFKKGTFKTMDIKIQKEAGWKSWTCNNNSLMNRSKKLILRLKTIVKRNNSLNFSELGVYFENIKENKTRQYDRMVIINLKTKEEIYKVIPSRTFNKVRFSELWSVENNFKEPIVKGSWRAINLYFASL